MIALEEEEQVVDGVINHGKNRGKGKSRRNIFDAAKIERDGALEAMLAMDGVDVNEINAEDGCAPIHLAAAHGHATNIALLMTHGGDINLQNESGATALHCATLNSRFAAAQLLVDMGAAPDLQDKMGCTALALAAYSGHVELAQMLIDAGATTTPRDKNGRTAIQVARLRENATMVAILGEGSGAGDDGEYIEARDLFSVSCLTAEADIEALCGTLIENRSMEKITLDGSQLGTRGATALGKALEMNETVSILSLANVLASAEETALITAALEGNITVLELNVSGCDGIGVNGFKAISKMLATNRCLRSLDVSFSIHTALELETISVGIKANLGLTKLELNGCKAMARLASRSSGLKPLADAIKTHKSIETLGLSKVIASVSDAAEIASALQENTVLRMLDVTEFEAGLPGIKLLIAVIKDKSPDFALVAEEKYMTLLERQKQIAKSMRDVTSKTASVFDINLRGCIQNDEDADRIFQAFRANNTVASLNLQDNAMTGRSLTKFMDAIKGNTALSSLNLAASIKTPEAAAALAHGLRQNGGIKYLSLHDCTLGGAEINALCDALVVNTTVVKMRGLSEDAQSAVRPYLEINETVAGSHKNAAPDLLFRCIQIGKLSAIPKLLAVRKDFEVVNGTNGTLIHALLLQERNFNKPVQAALSAVFHHKWVFDQNMAEIISRDKQKLVVFTGIVQAMADTEWTDGNTGRCVLHMVLNECRQRFLSGPHTVQLCQMLLARAPTLSETKDASGETPSEIAAFCMQAPEVQSMFMLGIISALQRRGWELEASQQELAGLKNDAQATQVALQDKLKGVRGLAEELDIENRNYKAKLIEMSKEMEQLRRQTATSPTLPGQTEVDDEVEIECDEYSYNGVTYLHDPSSNKVYSVDGDNPFVGKKLPGGSIDFGAVDSEDEAIEGTLCAQSYTAGGVALESAPNTETATSEV